MVVGMLAAVGVVLVPAVPGNAAPSDSSSSLVGQAETNGIEDCGPDLVCMWEDDYYGGEMYVRQAAVSGDYYIDWWNGGNEMTSVANHTACTVRLFDGASNAGPSIDIGPYTTEYDLSLRDFNNMAQSYSLYC